MNKAKKSLGQHFLTNESLLEKIVTAGDVSKGETVLEVGPGRGALTDALLKRGARVIAVEKDSDLIPFLQEKYRADIKALQFILIEGDALEKKEELETMLLKTDTYKIVANIPYYITGALMRLSFSFSKLPERVVLLVQDEVARRAASETKETILSLSLKAYGTPLYKGKVKAGSFSPPPKVDSAILSIEKISRDFFESFPEDFYFSIIKKAFSQKRKTLINTLFEKNKKQGEVVLDTLKLPHAVRAEDIPIGVWKKLVSYLYEASTKERAFK